MHRPPDFDVSGTNGPRSLSRAKAGTHSPSPTGSHTAAYTAKQGAFRTGALSLPSTRAARSRTSPGRVSERQTLPLLRLDPVCSRRTQRAFGTAMRLCASLFRGAAAPLGCVIFSVSVEIAACMPCAQGLSACATHGRYHYPRRALRAAETPDGRLSKWLICHFLRLPSSTPCAVTFSANTQISLSAISVANTFALWYDKFDKLELSN